MDTPLIMMDVPQVDGEANNTDQKARADELALSLNAQVLHRQKLVVAMEREFGQVCGGGSEESPEEAAIRLLRELVAKLAATNEKAAVLADENLNLSNRNGVLLAANEELRADLASAEEEAARFSKQSRLTAVRNTELLADIKALRESPEVSEVVDLSTSTKAPLTGDSFETFINFIVSAAIVGLDDLAGRDGDACSRIFDGRESIEKARVYFAINGVQIPFLPVFKRFHGDWIRITRAEAVRLVEEQFSDRTSPIFDLLDDLKGRLESQLGVPKDEET